jgi:hypothetical protein
MSAAPKPYVSVRCPRLRRRRRGLAERIVGVDDGHAQAGHAKSFAFALP